MSVDLSTLEAGDTVHFRCGGSAVIREIIDTHKGAYNFSFQDSAGHYRTWYQNGTKQLNNNIFDIIRIEKKPFDWSTVKAGMAFRNMHYEPIFFVGLDSSGAMVFDLQKSKGGSVRYDTFGGKYAHKHANLTRAPEHDIEVNND